MVRAARVDLGVHVEEQWAQCGVWAPVEWRIAVPVVTASPGRGGLVVDGGATLGDAGPADRGGVDCRVGRSGAGGVALGQLGSGELDAVVGAVALHGGAEQAQGLGDGALRVGYSACGLVCDGGESGDLGGVQEAQPRWWGCGGVEPVVGFLGGEEGTCAGAVVSGAGVADGEAGVKQSCEGVLAGMAGLKGGAVDAQGFAAPAFGAGLDGQVGSGAVPGPLSDLPEDQSCTEGRSGRNEKLPSARLARGKSVFCKQRTHPSDVKDGNCAGDKRRERGRILTRQQIREVGLGQESDRPLCRHRPAQIPLVPLAKQRELSVGYAQHRLDEVLGAVGVVEATSVLEFGVQVGDDADPAFRRAVDLQVADRLRAQAIRGLNRPADGVHPAVSYAGSGEPVPRAIDVRRGEHQDVEPFEAIEPYAELGAGLLDPRHDQGELLHRCLERNDPHVGWETRRVPRLHRRHQLDEATGQVGVSVRCPEDLKRGTLAGRQRRHAGRRNVKSEPSVKRYGLCHVADHVTNVMQVCDVVRHDLTVGPHTGSPGAYQGTAGRSPELHSRPGGLPPVTPNEPLTTHFRPSADGRSWSS